MRKDRIKDTQVTCEQCNLPFLSSRYMISQGKARFCSLSCSAKHRHIVSPIDQSGANNGNWKGGISQNRYRYSLKYRQEKPEQFEANRLVAEAKKNGTLIQLPCQVCGDVNSQGHHEDYSKPLEVVWLCPKHHRERHA